MLDVVYEVLLGAKKGKVLIDGEEWPIAFNTIIYDENGKTKHFYYNECNMATLVIRDEKKFTELMTEYVIACEKNDRQHFTLLNNDLSNKYKLFMSFLFSNFSTEDFLNPEQAIIRHTNFLYDNTFSYLDEGYDFIVGDKLFDSVLNVKREKQKVGMETPYKLNFNLTKRDINGKYKYPLAEISYGIVEENGKKICYVYSLIKSKEKVKEITPEELVFKKKINRSLYKLNDGVFDQESDDFKAYKNGESEYYPEGNISDVTHSFVLALTSFVTLLQKEGIEEIRVVPYLPLRYSSRYNAAMTIEDDKELKKELLERNDNIQSNATNKFIRTFGRVAYHLNGSMELIGYPYEYNEYATYKLEEQLQEINNPILEDVSLGILNDEKGKRL